MKTLSLLVMSLALGSSALFAGTPVSYSGKGSKTPQPLAPLGCECFAPGVFTLGVFGGAELPSDGARDDGLGGGALAEYFFTGNIGIQASYGAFAPNPAHHIYGADLVLRLPITSLCIAPYLMGGGGAITNGSTNGYWDAGIGIDVRFPSWNCVGLFADGSYHWASGSDEDFTLVRLGVKIPL